MKIVNYSRRLWPTTRCFLLGLSALFLALRPLAPATQSVTLACDRSTDSAVTGYKVSYNASAIESVPSNLINYTVPSVNTAPTISNIADLSTSQGTATAPIAFTVGDTQTAAGSLTVSGASSNPTLVPGANIIFGGSGANRTVALTPALNQTGTATIIVTARDGTPTASDTCVL